MIVNITGGLYKLVLLVFLFHSMTLLVVCLYGLSQSDIQACLYSYINMHTCVCVHSLFIVVSVINSLTHYWFMIITVLRSVFIVLTVLFYLLDAMTGNTLGEIAGEKAGIFKVFLRVSRSVTSFISLFNFFIYHAICSSFYWCSVRFQLLQCLSLKKQWVYLKRRLLNWM